MSRQDILTCLKNAVERGQSLEDAKLSLINAGYSRQDIEQATKELESFSRKSLPAPKPKFLPQLPKAPTK